MRRRQAERTEAFHGFVLVKKKNILIQGGGIPLSRAVELDTNNAIPTVVSELSTIDTVYSQSQFGWRLPRLGRGYTNKRACIGVLYSTFILCVELSMTWTVPSNSALCIMTFTTISKANSTCSKGIVF